MKKNFRKAKDAAWRVVDGEAVIVSPKDSNVTILNETGTFIWKLIDGSFGIEQIATALAEEFEVPPEQANKDVNEFIEDMVNKKLVTKNE